MMQRLRESYDLMLYSLVGFVILSCQSEPTEEQRFKEFIGSYNYEVTTEYLNQFESDLFRYYKTDDLSLAYQRYLEDWASGRPPQIYDCSSCEKFEAYHGSSMESSRIWYFYDTTWFEDPFKYYASGSDTIVQRDCDGMLEMNIEVIGPGKPSEYINHKWGLLMPSINLIVDSDSIVAAYMRRWREIGSVSPQVLARGALHNDINMSQSFFRRLIILSELHYLQMSTYGCVLYSSRCAY